jgi:hypothetical protein
MECPTCAERGYDNTDYHRLHRAWCDSVAEVERLMAENERLRHYGESMREVCSAQKKEIERLDPTRPRAELAE